MYHMFNHNIKQLYIFGDKNQINTVDTNSKGGSRPASNLYHEVKEIQ